QLYSDDNDDKLPPNDFVYDIISDQPIDDGASWCTNLAPFDANPAGIQGAVLFPYNASISIYHCPADKSTIETRGGTVLAQPRLRSYNLSQSINGYSDYDAYTWQFIPSFGRFTRITD